MNKLLLVVVAGLLAACGGDAGKEVQTYQSLIDAAKSDAPKLSAQIAKNVEIILEELEILDKMTKEKNKKTEIRLARKEEMVYSCVDLKPKHLDEIIKLTDLELLEVQEILVKLELMELVTEPIKNYYARAGG